MKTSLIKFRCSSAEKQIISALARKAGRTLSEYCREQALHGKILAVPKLTPEELHNLAQQALKVIPARAAYYAPLIGVTYGRITIRNQTSRWGSCSSRGHVRIHWNTVFVTKSERDYLYTHEAAHLTEMNHSPRFWQLVEVHCPGYKRARTILHSRTLGFL